MFFKDHEEILNDHIITNIYKCLFSLPSGVK